MKINSNKPGFGHYFIIDSGASKPEQGSLKILVRSSNEPYDKIYPKDGEAQDPKLDIVFPQGFTCSKDYPRGIAHRIKDTYKLISDRFKSLKDNDKDLCGILIHVPGPVINNFSKISPNLKIKNSDSCLKDINYESIPEYLRNFLLKNNIQRSDNFKLIATNDMLGVTTGIARILANHPNYKDEFQEGFFGTIFMPGGGTGVCDIKHKGDKVEILASESGHNVIMGNGICLEKYGTTVPALIRNYAEALNLNKNTINMLVKLGNAKLVSQYPIIEEKGSKSDILIETGLFEIIKEDDKNIYLKLKDINRENHIAASQQSLNKFANGAAALFAIKVNEGVNAVILAGPLIKGLKKDIEKNPSISQGMTLEDMIKSRMSKYQDETGKNMANLYNFKLISDIDVKDNTIGGTLVLKDGHFIGKEKRGNWLTIPIKKLLEN